MGIYTLISAIGMLFSFKLTAILLIYPRITKRISAANHYLAICFFCIGYVLLNAVLTSSKLYLVIPQLVFTAHIAVYLFMPFMFFYVREVVKKRSISMRDFYHFIPVLLYLADMGGQIFLGKEQKLSLLVDKVRNQDLSVVMVEGVFLPVKFHLYLSTILFLTYVVAKLSMLLRAYTSLGSAFVSDNRAWLTWSTVYSIMEILLIAPVCVGVYLDKSNNSQELWNKSNLLFTSLAVFSAIYLFLHPKIIYGLSGAVVTEDKADDTESGEPEANNDSASLYIDERELDRVEVLIREKVFNNQRFLSPKYDLQDFSSDTGVKVRVLSAYLSHRLQMSLSDLLNQMRVDYCCKLMDDPECYTYTLETLSEMSGFRNRTTFVNSFKKFKNSSPSAYWKWVRQNSSINNQVINNMNES